VGRKCPKLFLVALLEYSLDCEGLESNICLKPMITGFFQVEVWGHLVIQYFTKP